jgi:4-amino-4-deoxy-L-arabinose transferase-like glycosyltransferase
MYHARMEVARARRPALLIGWVLLCLAALVVGGIFATASIQPGTISLPVLALGIGLITATAVALVADRFGRSWGRALGIGIGILLVVIGALAEWFFWIGDVQGTSYQKIGTALIWAAVAGVAAAGTGVIATRGRLAGGVVALALAAVLTPAAIGQAMVWSSQQPRAGEPVASIPAQVADRDPLPSCGTEITPPDGPGPAEAAARQCLLAALQSGEGAELQRDYKTEEGQPVSEFIRVLSDGSVEVFVDATLDSYGSGAWERRVCDGLAAAAGSIVFELRGCGEPTLIR